MRPGIGRQDELKRQHIGRVVAFRYLRHLHEAADQEDRGHQQRRCDETWPTTSALRTRAPVCDTARERLKATLSANERRSSAMICSTGPSPAITLADTAIPMANARAPASMPISSTRGNTEPLPNCCRAASWKSSGTSTRAIAFQQFQARVQNPQPDDRACGSQEDCLRQDLPDDATTARAQCSLDDRLVPVTCTS